MPKLFFTLKRDAKFFKETGLKLLGANWSVDAVIEASRIWMEDVVARS